MNAYIAAPAQTLANQTWVSKIAKVLDSCCEFAVLRVEQDLDVIVHAPEAVLIEARSPNEAVEIRGEKRRRVLGQLLHNVGVPGKELVHAEVIAITISPDDQEILNHRPHKHLADEAQGPPSWDPGLTSETHSRKP